MTCSLNTDGSYYYPQLQMRRLRPRHAQPTAAELGSHPASLTPPTAPPSHQPPEQNEDTDNGHRGLCSVFIIGFAIRGAGLWLGSVGAARGSVGHAPGWLWENHWTVPRALLLHVFPRLAPWKMEPVRMPRTSAKPCSSSPPAGIGRVLAPRFPARVTRGPSLSLGPAVPSSGLAWAAWKTLRAHL